MNFYRLHKVSEPPTIRKNPWIHLSYQKPDAEIRLFCLPHSGGGASAFFSWPDLFGDLIEVCPIRLPGRENRLNDPPFTELFPLVESLAEALIPHLDKPFAFFGHSMGALVSFELTRYLIERYGEMPLHLFVSSFSAPHLYEKENPIHNLPEPEFIKEIEKLNGMAEDLLRHDEMMQILLPILRADFQLCETYNYEASKPLPCPISAFGGLQDSHVSRDKLEGWSRHTTGSFTFRMFPGDHFYLNTSRALLLRYILSELGKNI